MDKIDQRIAELKDQLNHVHDPTPKPARKQLRFEEAQEIVVAGFLKVHKMNDLELEKYAERHLMSIEYARELNEIEINTGCFSDNK